MCDYKERFEKLIAEYQGYIESTSNEETKAYFTECLNYILEMYRIARASGLAK